MTKRLTALVLALWLPCTGLLAGGLDAACPPASVGVSDLGYTSYLDGATIRGTNIDVLSEMQKRSGCALHPRWFPRGRLYAQFFSGQLELTGVSLRTPERDQHGTWLPYAYTHFELLLLNKDAGKFRSLAEFVEQSTARLNVTRGISYNPETQAQLDRLQKLGRLEYVSDFGVVFRKILAGRAEGTVAPPPIHLMNQRQFGMTGKMSASIITESPRMMVGLYVSNKVPPHIVQRYANALRVIVADGTVQKIYEHYLGAEITQRLYSDGVRDIVDALPPPR
jgi:polar amino acid transport system substrate-binding protein